MKLYRTAQGFFAEQDQQFFSINSLSWDSLIARDDLSAHLDGLRFGRDGGTVEAGRGAAIEDRLT